MLASQVRGAPSVLPSGRLPRLPLALFDYAVSRQAVSVRGDAEIFLNAPNVVLLQQKVEPAANGSRDITQINIVRNEVGAKPGSGDAFAARLRQGVVDTVAEAGVLGWSQPSENAAMLHLADHEAGAPWTVVRSPAELDRAIPVEFADSRAWIAADLTAGYSVLVPSRLATAKTTDGPAWWRIDPVTGRVLGMSALGDGATMGEYAAVLGQVAGAMMCGVKMAMNGPNQSAGQKAGALICLRGFAIGGMGGMYAITGAASAGGWISGVGACVAALGLFISM